MQLSNFNPPPSKWSKKQHEMNTSNRIPKQVSIKIHDLHQYVSSIFIGCSMPPLDEFLQLDIVQDSFILKLEHYRTDMFDNNDQKYDWIYYMESGKVWLKNINDLSDQGHDNVRTTSRVISANSISSSNKLNKKQSKKQKGLQIKQSNFFMLANVKKANQIQHLEIVDHQNGEYKKCLFGRIKINSKFNLNWYIQESSKHHFLSKIFRNQSVEISEHKLKGLSRFFKFQSFRRGTLLNTQGQENERLYVIKSGQCQFSKNFSYNQKNHSNIKTIKVANAGPQAVIGSQFVLFDFMGSSKMVTVAVKAMAQIQNKIQKLSFKFYDKNLHNYTVSVVSGYAQIYYISIAKFKQLCQKYVQQMPQLLRKNTELNYITLLRTTKQKLELQLIKIQRNQAKAAEQRKLVQAKLQAGYLQNQANTSLEESSSPIKLKKSQFFSTNLQGEQIQKTRNKRLEKKIQLLLQAKKTPVNYKKKIQIVLKQKFSPTKITESQIKDQHFLQAQKTYSPGMYHSQVVKKDLEGIFMNNQEKYRSSSIQRQNQILSHKQSLLKKRYESMNNMLIVHQQSYDKNKNKLFRMDLIRRGAISGKDQAINIAESKKKMGGTEKNFAQNFSNKIKKQYIQKINRANKIKQQFMTIRAQCQNCHCYDDIQSYLNIKSQKDIKMQAMKTGSAWRSSSETKNIHQEPLQKLHSRTKLMSQNASRKYHHNMHLLQKKRRFVSGSQRRLSAPFV